MIICKYLSLSCKPDYERSRLNTYQFVSQFQWFKQDFVLIQQKNKSLGNNDDKADQIAGRNDDNTLRIFRANLEPKVMFIICSKYRAVEKARQGQRTRSPPTPHPFHHHSLKHVHVA